MSVGPGEPGSPHQRFVGRRLGRFLIEGALGQGGMGLVLAGRDEAGRRAAVKVLHEAPGSAASKRFEREAKALAALAHPGVVRLLEADLHGQPPWLAMELIEGEDLGRALARGERLPPAEAARLVAEAAEAVAAAHALGVLHRDLKPANILVRAADRRAVVADFGLASSLDATRLTRTGAMLGTPAYLAPEVLEGAGAGPPADVWGLGTVLYAALCGRDPFQAPTPLELMGQITSGRPPRPRELVVDLPTWLEEACLAALDRRPDRRPSAAELARWLRGQRIGRGPRVLAAVILLVGAVAAAGLALAGRGRGAPAAGPASAAVAPTGWPAPDPRWRPLWTLAPGSAPLQPDSPAAWSGRRVTPMTPEALPFGFPGQVALLSGGRVEVQYRLADALQCLPARWPIDVCGTPYAERIGPRADDPEVYRVRVENDTSRQYGYVGHARWEAPGLRVQVRRPERVDSEMLAIGFDPDLTLDASLQYDGRADTLHAHPGGGSERVSSTLALDPARWTRIEFAPGEAPGSRLRLDGAVLPGDAALTRPARDGAVLFVISETELELRDLVVRGRPLGRDRPAWARVPVEVGARARVAAAFRWEPELLRGGPAVGLGDPLLGYCLEWDGRSLVLTRAGVTLGEVALTAPEGADQGWLVLERDADVLRASAGLGDATASLELADPLPLATDLSRAGVGSWGRSLELLSVEVHQDPEDPGGRGGWDLGSAVPGPADALHGWRRGALALGRLLDPRLAPAETYGPRALTTRHEAAARAARSLEQAAAGLEGAAAADARVRAVTAWILSGDPEQAARAAAEAARRVGLPRAATLLDWQTTDGRRPTFLTDVFDELTSYRDPAALRAAWRAVPALVPDRAGDAELGLARLHLLDARRVASTDPAEARRLFEAVVAGATRARGAGADPVACAGAVAEGLCELGRWEEAIPAWEENAAGNPPTLWYAYYRLARCQRELSRTREALEAALCSLAESPGREGVMALIEELTRAPVPAEARGLAAAALTLLSRLQPSRSHLTGEALALVTARTGSGEDDDLSCYGAIRLGQPAPRLPAGERPTVVLARAASGEQAAREALRDAARSSRLVRAIVTLDPELRGALGGEASPPR